MRRRCVYTCLIGNYENLNEQPVAADSDIDFICFTDNPDLQSSSWKFNLVKPVFSSDPIRSQRFIKIMAHHFVGQYDQSLYIDNTVILKRDPAELYEFFSSSDSPLLLPHHSYRERLLDEFIEVSRLGFDDQSRIFEQLNHYLIDTPEVLDSKPLWTAILLRNHHDEKLKEFSQLWLNHVLRYSRRDQLSINTALLKSDIAPHILKLDCFGSEYHEWPRIINRDREAGNRKISTSLMPPAAKFRALELENNRLVSEIESLRSTIETLNSAPQAVVDHTLPEQIRKLRVKVTSQEQKIATQRFRLEELRHDRTAVSQSLSWKVTRPLRKFLEIFQGKEKANTFTDTTTSALIIECANSRRIFANPKDQRAVNLAEKGGALNPNSLLMWQLLLAERTWSIIADVGANYGEMLANCDIPSDSRVVAFEPNSNIAPFLKKTLREAAIEADIVEKGLSSQEGTGTFFVDYTWSGTSSLKTPASVNPNNAISAQNISLTTFDKVFSKTTRLEEKSFLVKLDVEGHELDVLKGSKETFRKAKHFSILTEVLHLSDNELNKLISSYSIRALNLKKSILETLNAPSAQALKALLDNEQYYNQDVALENRK